MADSRVLVVGATGQLGGVIARKLAAAGVQVRALARSRDKLQALAGAGVELSVTDLNNVAAINEACKGITQIVATANNNMGKGPMSPTKIDLPAYQNLCAAARNAGVKRLIFVSTRGADLDAPVDLFRIKWYIENAIKRSGVPYVIVQASAFMDIWIDQLLAADIRKKGKATIFGDGTGVGNYIAVDDLAQFDVKIVEREDILNETIGIGGPSNVAYRDIATMVEKQLGSSGKRTHVPLFALKFLPPVVRPFNEVAARLMTLGYYATLPNAFPGWKATADRFGLAPRTVETYVAALKK